METVFYYFIPISIATHWAWNNIRKYLYGIMNYRFKMAGIKTEMFFMILM